ncbi:MAG: FkbM family methyltransferase [Rhodospirillaceae bacterium]
MSWSQADALRWVLDHPLNHGRRGRALSRWAMSQLLAHGMHRYRSVPFVDETRLMIGPGLTNANMQHYVGIGELDVMGFLMHYLKPDMLFGDIGANVGVISVLAAGAAGAKTVAFEPDPANYAWLERNIALNRLQDRVHLRPVAVSDTDGTLDLTRGQGAVNRAIAGGETGGRTVACSRLDTVFGGRALDVLKIDVEGYELPVIRGAAGLLASSRLSAVILELRGHGKRYGFDENEIRATMAAEGFRPMSYDPLSRRLAPVENCPWRVRDEIYLRDPDAAAERLRTAEPRRVIWGQRV